MKFSVIVPVYNVENYIEQCVQSILKQQDCEFELLLIDDGSTDESGKLCDNFDRQDDRVKCFHKENGGLADARNFGIERAQGEYLIFIDSDDYIVEGCFEKFAEVIQDDTQVLITRLVEAYPDGDVVKDEYMMDCIERYPDRKSALQWIFKGTKNTWPSVKYIISSEFVKAYRLCFKRGYLHEDIDWTAYFCFYAQRFAVCDMPWYYHRMRRQGSITNVIRPKRVVDVLDIAYDLIDGGKGRKLSELPLEESTLIIKRLMCTVYASLSYCRYMDEEGKKQVEAAMKQYGTIFRYAPKMKYKMYVCFMRVFGYKAAIRLLNIVN